MEENPYGLNVERTTLSTVYGPVPSWRFGRSLGIDIIQPPKTCSFNCVYCQLGRTQTGLSSPEEFKDYVRANDVERDLERYLEDLDMESIDVVTFSGGGEPTLNPEMGEILDRVRHLTAGKVPIVLLTNSSLLHRNYVRRTVAGFDIVVAKLDAGEEGAFRTINRPIASAPNIETIIESIKKLRKETKGTLMTQTMFLNTDFGFTNCDGRALDSLFRATVAIEPDVIQIDTPYRPGGESFVKRVSIDRLKSIGKRFEEYIESVNAPSELWVFGVHDKRGRKAAWKEHASIQEAIVGLLKRRPCRVVDIADSLGISYKEALGNIYDLLEDCRVVKQIASNEEEYYRPR